MYTEQELLTLIIAQLPAIAAIISAVISFIKNKHNIYTLGDKIENMKNQVLDAKEYKSLKQQLLIVHEENIKLKKTLNELLTKIDRVERPLEVKEDKE